MAGGTTQLESVPGGPASLLLIITCLSSFAKGFGFAQEVSMQKLLLSIQAPPLAQSFLLSPLPMRLLLCLLPLACLSYWRSKTAVSPLVLWGKICWCILRPESFCLQVVSRAQVTSAMIKFLCWISLFFSPMIRSFIARLLLTRELWDLGRFQDFHLSLKLQIESPLAQLHKALSSPTPFDSGSSCGGSLFCRRFLMDQIHLFLVLIL